MKIKLLILLCMAALPAMTARAADNAEKPIEAKILPDGVYRVRGEDSTEKGVTVKRCDTDGTVILLDRLTSQFGTASMTSAANDNTRFRIDLKSAGPFAEGEGTGHKALVIDGLCTTIWGQSDPDKQHRMDLSSQVVGKEASARIAARLGIEPRMRHHPGHRMEVRYLPKKPVFKPGEPVVLRMEIRNVGDRTFTFVDGGQQRGPRNNQFGFTAFRSAGKGAEVPDTGDADNFGGPSGFITLEPGQVFGKEVDLTKWFDLSKPDTYKIEGRFEMNISRNPAGCLIFGWDEVAQGTTMVTLGNRKPGVSPGGNTASAYFEALTKGDVERANALVAAPFSFDRKQVLQTKEEVEKQHQEVVAKKGMRKVPEYTVSISAAAPELDRKLFPEYEVFRITLAGDDEHIDIYVTKDASPKVIGVSD